MIIMANIAVKSNFRTVFPTYIRCFSNTICVRSDKVPEEAIPKNVLQEYIGTQHQPKGQIYDKRPFRMNLKANKKYAWCTCGYSKSQPLCDGSHKIPNYKIQLKPIVFIVEETKEYWLCNCKQSDHRPFCDGTHKKEEIQAEIRHHKM